MARRFTLLPPSDPFAAVRDAYDAHRAGHSASCIAYAISYEKALFLAALASGAGRVLEVGTALGYSTLWLARGVGGGGVVDTVEWDAGHAKLAREQFEKHEAGSRPDGRPSGRVSLHVGDAREVVPALSPGYGLAFLDVEWNTHRDIWPDLLRLLRPGAFVCLSNVWVTDEKDPRSGVTERRAARDLIRRIQDDPSLSYSLVTAGSPMVVVGRRN
jgi:predicted O-methyltransferase YrrM